MRDHTWDGIVSRECSQSYIFRENEDRGILDGDVEALEARIGACSSSERRCAITAHLHFRALLLVAEVEFPGAPSNWKTALNAGSN